MTRDIHTLTEWLRCVLIIAAVCTTAFPVLYSFANWTSTALGKIVMAHSIAFALAMDVTVLFQYWHPNDILAVFWVEALMFTFIAIATTALTYMLWLYNYRKRVEHGREARPSVEQSGV